jgi:hypothetical protein
MKKQATIHGLMVEFLTAQEILEATRHAWQAGFRDMDAYTPYPVEGLAVTLGMKKSRIPAIAFAGGIVGGTVGFIMQIYSMSVDYPLNVGGRPLNSWPVFIPITFETLVLVASISTMLGVFLLNGLPRLHHPVFSVPEFARASQDRFFLCIEATDSQFELEKTTRFLLSLSPHGKVIEVPLEEIGPPEESTQPLQSTISQERTIVQVGEQQT